MRAGVVSRPRHEPEYERLLRPRHPVGRPEHLLRLHHLLLRQGQGAPRLGLLTGLLLLLRLLLLLGLRLLGLLLLLRLLLLLLLLLY